MEYITLHKGKSYVLCNDQTFRGERPLEHMIMYTNNFYYGSNAVGCHLYPNGTWKVIQIQYYQLSVEPFFMPFVEEIVCPLPNLHVIPLFTSLRKVIWYDPIFDCIQDNEFIAMVRSALYQMRRYPHQLWIPDGSQQCQQRLVTCWNKEIHRLQMLSVVYQITPFKNHTVKEWYTRIYQHLLLDATVPQENSHVLEKNE